MDSPNSSEGAIGGQPSPPHSPLGWLAIVLIITLGAILGVGCPAYKRVTKERDEFKTENEKIKSETHEKIITTYKNGKIASRVVNRSSKTLDNKYTTDKTKIKSETITKRGGVGLDLLSHWSGVDLVPRPEIALTAEILTIPFLDIPIRAGLSYSR